MSASSPPARGPLELPERPRVLVIRFSALGDTLLTFPAVQQIRCAYPDAHITYLTDVRLGGLLAGAEAVDEVLTIDRLALKRLRPSAAAATLRRVLTPLAVRRWHAAIDFQAFTETALLARWSRAPVRVGRHYKTRARWLYTHWIEERHPDCYMSRAHVDTLERAGVVAPTAPDPEERRFFRVPAVARDAWQVRRQALSIAEAPLAILFVGAAKAEKRWPARAFGQLAAVLSDHGLGVLVCGGPDERHLVEAVLTHARERGCPAVDAGVGTLAELAAILASGAITISNDTGPMHLSVAVGTPTIGIFRQHTPHFRPPAPHVCIEPAPRASIETVTVDEVAEAARRLLARPAPARPSRSS